ncbi:P-loop containing nucleoside triphosphate hydrolase protein, partial [Gorgonomyces haynaldii]
MASQYLERVRPNLITDTLAQSQWAEKKWVWVADPKEGYLQASIIAEKGEEVEVQFEDGTKKTVNINSTEKMNPPKFDKVEDMADLTHLNVASVVHNLRLRYYSNLIYTYSGLFCVTVNPYKKLPIYSDEIVRAYKGKKRKDLPPHVFSVADQAYHDMLLNRENQSILITGESGAGKTENTKKVIQYLAATASANAKALGQLEQQILQANPILEAFGNAQTIRNNNSSRFGKFIRIEFGNGGTIAGATIERYLLEKSRVTHQTAKERNYHIFYQLLKGASPEIKNQLILDGSLNDYRFTKNSNKNIDGVDDAIDFRSLRESFNTMLFSETDQLNLFRVIAAVLHLGNITLQPDREEMASLTTQAASVVEKVCHVMGIPVAEFSKNLLKPQVKAGRDWVTKAMNVPDTYYSIESLARSLYERMFGDLLDKINKTLYTSAVKTNFIGVLDIAGFEIFETNSFEQLCINYTNERLQQFFNHHMFILEQEEYKRENIDWKFQDYGLDLQPTIDLIEKSSPPGLLSLLDEECVMPKATDKTFYEKVEKNWKQSPKFTTPKAFNSCFKLHHYAGVVEYNVTGWLDKNKDPLNAGLTRLLANSTEPYIALLFADALDADNFDPSKPRGITKKGIFRTVGQMHKESLVNLMNQLYSTTPHFVRCIIPNEEKKPGKLDVPLVVDQLNCNGVLEGLRIARAGYPNRVIFQDFRTRYEILAPGIIPKGYFDGRKAAQMLLEHLALDRATFQIGVSKVFFKAGVLAELENRRDTTLAKIVIRIQAIIRGWLVRRRFRRKVDQVGAIRVIQKNARIYVNLREWSWWRLYVKLKPMLNVSRTDEELKRKDALIKELEEKYKKEQEDKNRVELARAALDVEKKRIEDLLLQEQRAAEDMSVILSRTQQREVDLNDRLAEIIQSLEEKGSQNEELNAAKRKIEAELRDLREKSSLDAANLDRLEKEKSNKDQQLKQIQEEF